MASSLHETLTGAAGSAGVLAVGVVARSGYLIDGATLGDVNLDAVGALAADTLARWESHVAIPLVRGALRSLLFEWEDTVVVIAPVGTDCFIAMVTDRTLDEPQLRLRVDRIRETIARYV